MSFAYFGTPVSEAESNRHMPHPFKFITGPLKLKSGNEADSHQKLSKHKPPAKFCLTSSDK